MWSGENIQIRIFQSSIHCSHFLFSVAMFRVLIPQGFFIYIQAKRDNHDHLASRYTVCISVWHAGRVKTAEGRYAIWSSLHSGLLYYNVKTLVNVTVLPGKYITTNRKKMDQVFANQLYFLFFSCLSTWKLYHSQYKSTEEPQQQFIG